MSSLSHLALLACLPLSAASAAQKYALLIGIEHYPSAPAKPPVPQNSPYAPLVGPSRFDGPVWETLDGPLNDVRAMYELLTSAKFGFPPQNVHILPEQQATRAGILAAMQKWLVEIPHPGDFVVFYYAGHGSQQINSLDDQKPFHLEETVVPIDANTDYYDVRDKEMARIFNAAVDKRIRLTAIYDSCHSGGIARGIRVHPAVKLRMLPYNPVDVKAPVDHAPPPVTRPGGALVLSATQPDQAASEWLAPGQPAHGAFTLALTRALRMLPADTSAQEVFSQVSIVLDSLGLEVPQQPAFDGPAERKNQPLLASGGARNQQFLIVESVAREAHTVTLNGGLYNSIGPGTELDSNAEPPVHLRVRKNLAADSVLAEPVPPAAAAGIHTSDVFHITRLVVPPAETLRVWLPSSLPSDVSREAVKQAVQNLYRAAIADPIDDPVCQLSTHELFWNGQSWILHSLAGQHRNQRAKDMDLGPAPTQAQLRAAISTFPEKPKLFLNLPPTPALYNALRKLQPETGAVTITDQASDALYLLAGRATSTNEEFAWFRPTAEMLPLAHPEIAASHGSPCSEESSFPPRTDWQPQPQTATVLLNDAARLARLKIWLDFPLPPAGSLATFPYKLVLTDEKTGRSTTTGMDAPNRGHIYDVKLAADRPVLPNAPRRWVYLMSINCQGESVLLFGDNDNQLPRLSPSGDQFPPEIPLGSLHLEPPYGLDNLVLIVTSRPVLDLSVFSISPVTREATEPDPLADLYSTSHVRSLKNDYAVQYIRLRTAP